MSKHRASGYRPDLDCDASRAHSGRIHDYLLRGKDAYPVDHDAGAMLSREAPIIRQTAGLARIWLARAVEYLASVEGIHQFVELGCGYPNEPNVHEVAGKHLPNALTLYVDDDAVVGAHARALFRGGRTRFLLADINDTEIVIDELTRVMDLSLPVALCMSFIAEFLYDAAEVCHSLLSALSGGSYVVLTHVTRDMSADTDGDPNHRRSRLEQIDRAIDIYSQYGILFRPRSRDEIEQLLVGCDLLEPGLASPLDWHSSTSELDQRRARKLGWEASADSFSCGCYVALACKR